MDEIFEIQGGWGDLCAQPVKKRLIIKKSTHKVTRFIKKIITFNSLEMKQTRDRSGA